MVFSREKINTGRQTEIDLARGFSALLMIVCHVGLYLGNNSNEILYTFSDIIGSEPCAPVFMALMGAGLTYSKHQDPKTLFIRGIKIFLTGYLLSTLRTLIPRLILLNIDEWTSLDAFFVVDIFQFAGLACMFLALLKKIKLPSWSVLILSLVMVWVGQIFIANPPAVENKFWVYVLDLFIPISSWSCFPFLTWFFFPAFGLNLGEALLHCSDKKKFYGMLLPISFCGVLYIYYQFYKFYPYYAENYYFGGNYYYMGIKNVLLTALFIIFVISFWYFAEKIFPKFINDFLIFLSKNLTTFYIFSWIFISALIHIFALKSIALNIPQAIIVLIIILALSYLATYGVISAKKRKKE